MFMAVDILTKEMGIVQMINELQDLAMQLAAQASVRPLKGYDPSSQIDSLKARQADQAEAFQRRGFDDGINATLGLRPGRRRLGPHKASIDVQ